MPHFFAQVFPDWFAGVAFAAIAIGALVPAAIMSIAAANLFTRNVYREFIRRDAPPAEEARVSKIASLVVKFGALLFVLEMDRQNAINLQLLGGVWILQTLLTIVAGLYTRWFHRWALLLGWAAAMVYGTVTAYRQTVPNAKIKMVNGQPVTTVHGLRHFGSSIADFPFTSTKVYIAASALVINVVVAVVLTVIFRAIKAPAGVDDDRARATTTPTQRRTRSGSSPTRNSRAAERRRLLGAVLHVSDLEGDLGDAHLDAFVQALRRAVAAATAGDE